MEEANIYIRVCWNELIKVGGYGAIIERNGIIRELSASYCPISQRRLSLIGVVAALDSLPRPCKIKLFSGSEYVISGVRKKNWLIKWSRRNWRRSDRQKVKNADLWIDLLDLMERHNIDFVWIREYNGFEWGEEYHDRCYELAYTAIASGKMG